LKNWNNLTHPDNRYNIANQWKINLLVCANLVKIGLHLQRKGFLIGIIVPQMRSDLKLSAISILQNVSYESGFYVSALISPFSKACRPVLSAARY
jgi:hypothetical protein